MLTPGQIIRYGPALYRVDYVNASRAFIVPLAKRHVVLGDREFDAQSSRGLNISPNSFVEIIDDIERERTRMELELAERELAAARREIAEQGMVADDLEVAERELAAARAAQALAPKGTPTRATHAWSLRQGPVPAAPAGSLKAAVVAFLAAHPGATTKEIAEALAPQASAGACAACLDRFSKAGVVIKS